MVTTVRETERKFDAAEHDAHHDAVVAGPGLRKIGIQAHQEGDNGYTYGLLHGQQRTEIHDAERALPAAWRRLTARKPRRWLR